ncbi:ABC-2 type transport system permease protein [Sediminibacillus albus]|uniref:ABC-2 type transport system permease protein n=2 Tax=Sediminibacillus albus TaxID=407036 RepID=A0A1G9AQ07_9BACI|nr:ABC-2 type transport system permease protein [Sediminibacillus albus]
MNLVYNEQVKLYARKSTWIMFVILAVIILGIAILGKTVGDLGNEEYGEDWRQQLEQENAELTEGMDEEQIAYDQVVKENNYYLENDIKPQNYDVWQSVIDNSMLSALLSLFTIIVAAGIVAHEFRWGTIKLLLIRPVSRTKILFSKYVSVLLFALTSLVFLLLFSWLTGAVFFGVNGINPTLVLNSGDGFVQVSALHEITRSYGFSLVNLVMMSALAFMISSIFRNSGLAIGFAIFLMMAGSSIMGFFLQYDWAKFILFANTNLDQYYRGTPLIEGMTLPFSVMVLLVYYLVFLVLSWVFFTKRDVAGH